MKIFWSNKQLAAYVSADRVKLMEAASHDAAKEVVHHYLAWRPLDWWGTN
jgi:hypothetical protein